jgi:hypothetical protein
MLNGICSFKARTNFLIQGKYNKFNAVDIIISPGKGKPYLNFDNFHTSARTCNNNDDTNNYDNYL